ncbi:hypothetical protein PAXINDRAFT_159131, partial [Paxillus involutus ATCC 200175]
MYRKLLFHAREESSDSEDEGARNQHKRHTQNTTGSLLHSGPPDERGWDRSTRDQLVPPITSVNPEGYRYRTIKRYWELIQEQLNIDPSEFLEVRLKQAALPDPYDGKDDIERFKSWLQGYLRWCQLNKLKAAGSFDRTEYSHKKGVIVFVNNLEQKAACMVQRPNEYTFKRRFLNGLPDKIGEEILWVHRVSAEHSSLDEMIEATCKVENAQQYTEACCKERSRGANTNVRDKNPHSSMATGIKKLEQAEGNNENKPAWKNNNPTLRVFAVHMINEEKEENASTGVQNEDAVQLQEIEEQPEHLTVPDSEELDETNSVVGEEYYLEEYKGSNSGDDSDVVYLHTMSTDIPTRTTAPPRWVYDPHM